MRAMLTRLRPRRFASYSAASARAYHSAPLSPACQPATHIFSYSLLVKSREHFGLTVEELADSAIRVQEPADRRVIFQTAEPFRGYRTHDIQPLGNWRTVGAEPAVDHGPGERVPGQVHEVIVELRPVIVSGAHVHGLVVVEKVEREGQHAAIALQLEVERRGTSKRRKEGEPRKGAG